MTAMTLDELRLQLEELRASRARIAAATDAERRLLERELHDGVQQHLVALSVNVQLARQLVESDPTAATERLAEMARDIREALESVRRVAQRIYPPLLIDRGLAEALAGAASAAGIPTRVDLAGLDRYPDDAEAAVYFCCIDALRDAAELGGNGARATLRVWEDLEELHFEVTVDNDPGDPVSPGPKGEPSRSIEDRLGALGGHLDVSSDPGHGRRVLGSIPLVR